MSVLSDLTTQTGSSTAGTQTGQTGSTSANTNQSQTDTSQSAGLSNLASTSQATGTSQQNTTQNQLGTTQQTGVSQTTLPQWYMDAQQQLAQQAQTAAGATPGLGGTVAQGAINTLSGSTNPFTTATGTLQNIATGAASPWNVAADGTVTPNTATALGGLFQAQNQQLNQLMPTQVIAPQEAANIASGQFGSLRGQTAKDSAMANAQANLFAQQNAAAIQNQQTGVQAATGAGNVAQQGITNQMNVGQAQMVSPLTNIANLGNILAGINAPQTVTNTLAGQTAQTGTTQAAGQTGQTGQTSQTGQTAQTGTTSSQGNTSQTGTTSGTGFTNQTGTSTGTVPVLSGLAALGTTGQGILNALGLGGSSGILATVGGKIASALGLTSLSGSGITTDSNGNPVPGSYPLADGGTITINNDGSSSVKNPDGTVSNFNANGDPYTAATNSGTPPPVIDPSLPTDTTGGGYTDPNTGVSVPS